MSPAEPIPSRMTSFSQDDRGLRAAVAYYLEGKTMDAIARELQVSRATVSRLLARARAEGIVEITVFTPGAQARSEEHTSELQSRGHLVCRLLLEKKKDTQTGQAAK